MPSDETIRADLSEIMVDILGVEPEEIVPDARFFSDLGGESIDLLDLSFRCEQRFKTKIAFQQMLDPSALEVGGDGALTDEAMRTLKAKLPFFDWEKAPAKIKLDGVQDLLTVEAIARYLTHTLSAQQA